MNPVKNWKRYIGSCGYHATVGDFLDEREDEWTDNLCSFVNEMFPEEEQLDPDDDSETVKSYRETFRILWDSLGNSACSNLSIFDLEIVFEYVIPISDPNASFVSAKRADVVLFCKGRSIVLEFKTGKSERFPDAKKYEAIGQVNDYMRGLRDWHHFADGDSIRGAVVLCILDNEYDTADYPPTGILPAAILSPDRVTDFISSCFPKNSRPVPNPDRWLRAFGTTESPGETIARDISSFAAANHRLMTVLNGDEKAAIRKRIANRLGLSSTAPLKPIVAKLTNGKWELRDAVVQLLENLSQSRLELLFTEWSD